MAQAIEAGLDAFKAAARAGDCERVLQALVDLAVETCAGEAAKGNGDSPCATSEGWLAINDCWAGGAPLLVWAAEQPDVSLTVIRLLLDEGAEIDLLDEHHGESALFKAIRRGSEELVELLVARGAEVFHFNDADHNPLMVASMEGSLPIVRRLLSDTDIRVDDVNCKLQTALRCAVSAGHAEVARALLRDHGANPIYCAARCEPKAPAQGADIEAHNQCFEMIKAVRSVTPTFIAAVRGGDMEEVERLLGQGGWGLVNALYLEGRLSPLMVAAERGDMPMAELLMRHGARPELEKDPTGDEEGVTTALSVATKAGHEDMAKYLLAKGELAPHGGAMKNALWQACQYGRVALLSEYLSRLQYHEKTWLEGLKRAGRERHRHCFDMLLQHAEQASRRGLIDGVMMSDWIPKFTVDRGEGEPFNSIVLSCLKHLGPGEPDLEQPHWAKVATLASASSARFPVLQQLLEQGVNTHKAAGVALQSVLREKGMDRETAREDRIIRARYLLARGVGCGELERGWALKDEWASRRPRWGTSVLRTLVDSGASFSVEGGCDKHVLTEMARHGKLEELGLLLERGVAIDNEARREALLKVAEEGREDAVALFLHHDAKGDVSHYRANPCFGSNDRGGIALFQACRAGHRGVVKRLLDWGGVNVNFRFLEDTALGESVGKGDWQGAVLLLGAGAYVDARKRCTPPVDGIEVDEAAPSISAVEWNSIVEDFTATLEAAEREDVVTPELSRLGARDGACVLNAREKGTGRTVLTAAALKGHVTVAKFLLGCGVDPDMRDDKGQSALHHACVGGHTEMVQLLLEAGANTLWPDRAGKTPFELACTHGHAAVAGLVLAKHKLQAAKAAEERAKEHRASKMMPLLRRACVEGDVGIVSLLMQEGDADVTVADLVAASARGHVAVVKALLESPEMMRQQHTAFLPALKSAVAMGQAEVMETLLQRAPSLLRQADSDKMTLLMTAAAWEQVDCVRRLLDTGAGEGLHDGEGWEDVLLICGGLAAWEDRQVEIVRLLLAAAARELRQQPGGEAEARLTVACHRILCQRAPASMPLVQLLLDQGADIDAADAADGMTPLMAAVQACNYLVARHLLERGASWGPGDYGQPDCDPFYRACWIRDVDLIRLFIEKGAVERYNLEAAQEARVGNWKEGLVKGLHAVAQAGDAALLRAMLKIGGKLLRQEMMEWERNLGASTPYAYGRFDREKREEEKRTLRAMSELMESWRTFLTVPGDGPTCALGDTQGPRLTTPPNALGYQLIMACDQARGDEVRDLLACGAKATWEEKSTLRTPLMSAARAGSVTCVRLLLQRLREQGRWDALDHRDVLGRTALWHACFERHADVVELLMAHGADADTDCDVAVTQQASSLMNSKDWWVWRGDRERSLAYQGKSPLEVAEMRHCVCLKAIKNIEAAARQVWNAIRMSPADSEPVSRLLDRYTNGPLHLDVSLALAGLEDGPLLCKAAVHGSVEAAKVLLRRGACPERGGRKGSPLMLACKAGHSAVASLLLSHGAKAHKGGNIGRTPLILAAVNAHVDTVAAVLRYPEGLRTLNKGDPESRTPLWLACKHGHAEVALELVVAGAEYRNGGGELGLTPLQLAKRRRDWTIIALLMRHEEERLYYLHKCRLVQDSSTLHSRLPPPFEARRVANKPLPRLETGDTGETGTGRGRKRDAAGEVDPEVVLVRAVMRYVVHDLKADLYRELAELWQPHVDLSELEDLPEYEDSDEDTSLVDDSGSEEEDDGFDEHGDSDEEEGEDDGGVADDDFSIN